MNWLEMMRSWTLPVSYLHIVFTLPHELGPLILKNAWSLYNLQFEASQRTLKQVAKDAAGVLPGMSMVLHTWGQACLHHPHIHVLQTAGD